MDSAGKGTYSKPDDLSLIPGAHMVEWKKGTDSYQLYCDTCLHAVDTHTQTKQQIKCNKNLKQ